ncbi:MAG: membrane protein insertase YidC, partial [Burkholderiales bacterium]|nr:membrane protein insertase YidC [Burkholderiales bacterium]
MTDIRRTLLWVVFTMSLVLLWDAWNRHTGQPTLFGVPTQPAASAAAAGSSPADVPTAGAAAPTPAAASSAPAVQAAAGERVEIRTDRFKASFDSTGGTLVRLELLDYRDNVERTRNVVLFERDAKRLYLAQTGLITAQSGLALPTHLTPMSVQPGPRELADGHNVLELRFEGRTDAGVRLVKTYSFERGSYAIGVKHEVFNDGAAVVAPQLYLQLARDGQPPEGESRFYFTFTGPAVYTDEGKFQKIKFEDIDKGKADYVHQASDGWIAMVQHYFASAWLLPAPAAREYRVAKVADNQYTIAMVAALGDLAPGTSKLHQATLYAGPQEEHKLAALAPGLDLVKDYGWFTMLAKPLFWLLDQLHKVIGNWGWAIVALVVLLKIAFYWLNASAYRSMAKMKAINPRVMELRERYKGEPQKMQQEMMRIYREEKVN